MNAPATTSVIIIDDHPLFRKGVSQLIALSDQLHLIGEASSGEEGLELARALEPDLILLDLNMPRMDGREVLAELKNDTALKHIPVVVLTTSQAEEDILRAYELHANCFIGKPVDFAEFVRVVKSIESFWFSVVRLPRSP